VVRAKPDGYTLVVSNITTNLLNPLVGDVPMQFDPFKDLVPVARLVDIPGVFLATKVNFPPNTLKEVVEYAKSKPEGFLNHTTAGHLAYSHIDLLMFQKRAGIKMTSVPLRAGAGGGQIDMINGQIHVSMTNAATVLPLVKAGKIKALAVTSEKRLAAYPDTPTMKEAGFEGIGTNAWQAAYAPAGTPKDVLEKLHKAFNDALADEKVRKQLEEMQFTVIPIASVDDAKAWMESERKHWAPIVEEAKVIVKEINK
ncbi:MAG: tripartite tricarboxylate transporter substrate binding protein, partial [Rhizobiales bacterium]|nr:tripartite tricarboxylate transporter substrate binding protein [Hyphomicrobiales bacterium]